MIFETCLVKKTLITVSRHVIGHVGCHVTREPAYSHSPHVLGQTSEYGNQHLALLQSTLGESSHAGGILCWMIHLIKRRRETGRGGKKRK